MRSPEAVLRFLANAALDSIGKTTPIGNSPIELIAPIAVDVRDSWVGSRSLEERYVDIESLGSISETEATDLAERIVNELTTVPNPSATLRRVLLGYLTTMLAAARECSIKKGDPSPAPEPTTASEYFERAHARFNQGDLDAAIDELDRGIQLDPTNVYAYLSRGGTQHEKRNFDAAINDYEHALRLDPKSANAHFVRGWTRQTKGDLDAALADYD